MVRTHIILGMPRIHDSIREARRQIGWSQRELAGRAAVGQSHVQRIERGQDVRLSTLEKLAKTMGATVMLVPDELAATVEADAPVLWPLRSDVYLDSLIDDDDDRLVQILDL